MVGLKSRGSRPIFLPFLPSEPRGFQSENTSEMSLQNFKETLTNLLKTDARLVDELGELLINIVHEFANNLDPQLIELLLNEPQTREKFFLRIKEVYVFKQSDFKFFLDENKIDNSYTQYENKIGLSFGSRLLRETTDVVLNFPYKDCILEGGQSTEEGTDIYFEYDIQAGDYVEQKAKRKEVFFNQILARDEIDRLFEPKAFSKIKRYTREGDEQIECFSRDENDTITDNLIIKGNNLLALHSLKHEFRGRVKLIYIDPPYNTENDSFAYNDNFKHSTWLTFMKNRLEVARELLQEDGVIWISLSDKEAHYCKVLCDSIFKREHFVSDIIWNSTKSVTNTAIISDAHTHNLLYAKDISILKRNRAKFRLAADESKFSNPDNDYRGKWVADPFQVGGERPNQMFEIINPNTGVVYKPNKGNSWKNEKKVFDDLLKENRIVFGTTGEAGPQRKRFWSEAEGRGEVTTTLWKDLPTTTNGTQHLKELFGDKVFDNPKPEGLIKRIIELSTEENDIVLDYHAGSGTTAAVAHKMKRQFITIEQMDYIESVTVERLKKVIEGEQGGISKAVNWQGGGSFIYLELAKNNQNAIEKIAKAESYEVLMAFFEEMYDKYFLGYNLKIKEFEEDKTKEGAFKNLPLERQKQIFAKMLDLNQLYVNVSDMEDARYALSQEAIAITKSFYQ
jgi:adenine-specific DNA-methyltransferase